MRGAGWQAGEQEREVGRKGGGRAQEKLGQEASRERRRS